MVNFTTVACRIFSRLKWYKNYKNRLRLTKVIVKNKMSRFFMVHCVYTTPRTLLRGWSNIPFNPVSNHNPILTSFARFLKYNYRLVSRGKCRDAGRLNWEQRCVCVWKCLTVSSSLINDDACDDVDERRSGATQCTVVCDVRTSNFIDENK